MTAAIYRANGKDELTPPPHFTEETDLLLWLPRFEMYVQQAEIPEKRWTKELLPLLIMINDNDLGHSQLLGHHIDMSDALPVH